MTFNDVENQIKSQFPDAILERQELKPDPALKIAPEKIHAVIQFLKEKCNFETLSNVSGVDYPAVPALCVAYHPFSFKHKLTVCLKVYLPREGTPKIKSVTDLFKGANWMERETYDLFGVIFEGHPDMRRILMPNDWQGFPMRKDYETPDYYNGMPVPLYFEPKTAGKTEGHA